MKKSTLAAILRDRQRAKKLVAPEIINAVSDDVLINSYITCACCGDVQVTQDQLRQAIASASDADSFFQLCDTLGRKPHQKGSPATAKSASN